MAAEEPIEIPDVAKTRSRVRVLVAEKFLSHFKGILAVEQRLLEP
jgi:hypothetical protein